MMKLAYMAHPLGPDGEEREKNRANAIRWFGWLHDHFPSLVFTANWISLSEAWPGPESDDHVKRMLDIDMIHVDKSDLIFFVGGKISPGMLAEQSRAAQRGAHQVDLTFMGYEVPPKLLTPQSDLDIDFYTLMRGMVSELNKAFDRIVPLAPEDREAFQRNLLDRLATRALGASLLGPYRCERECCKQLVEKAKEHEVKMRSGFIPDSVLRAGLPKEEAE